MLSGHVIWWMRLHKQVPFEECIGVLLAAVFTRDDSWKVPVFVKGAHAQALAYVLDLITQATSLVLT